MKLLVQTSFCAMLCAKRLMCKATTSNLVQSHRPNTYAQRSKMRDRRSLFDNDNDLSIRKYLQHTKESIDDKQWAEARQEAVEKCQMKEAVIDSQIIDLCFYYQKPNEALNYVRYLQRNNCNLNLNIIGKYFKSYYIRGTELSDEEEDHIYTIYDNLRKKFSVLNGDMCTDCIAALALTKRWKETIELLDMMKTFTPITVSAITPVICAAFKNNRPDIAWDLMDKSVPLIPIHNKSMLSYLDYCQKYVDKLKWQSEIDKMFEFWKEKDIQPLENVVKAYCNFYECFGYRAQYTIISKKGKCNVCNTTLSPTTLSNDEFKTLSTQVLNNVLIGKNLFCSTSPQELKSYMLFVKTMRPYDVVIDGLNVAYATKTKDGHYGSLQNILNVVNYFGKDGKKVLVIGRAHMNWWNKETMRVIKTKADVHLVKNISEDDPFLLHVTLVSGPQTYFVSRDLMRSQKSRLDPSLQSLFKRWQLSRQYLYNLNPKTSNITLKPPIQFDIGPQQNNDGWHLPYRLSNNLVGPDIYTHPQNWACLKKIQQ